MKKYVRDLLFVLAMMTTPLAVASNVEELTAVLHEFLANSDKLSAHERS